MNEAAVLNDMGRSLGYVKEKIRDVVKELLPDWQLKAIEGENNEICRMLDMSCGIDYLFYSQTKSQIYGVASRVQYGQNYRTFTVRKSRESGVITEYEKIKLAMYHKSIFPYCHIQAYITNERVTGLAIVKTVDLIHFIDCNLAEVKRTNADKIGQAEFYVCQWDKIKSCGYKVLEYKEGDSL